VSWNITAGPQGPYNEGCRSLSVCPLSVPWSTSQGRIQESALRGAISLPLPHPLPFSPSHFPIPSFPFPSRLLPSYPIPSLPLEVGPVLRPARGSGGAWAFPQRIRAEPGRQTVFGEFYRLKIAPVVAMVTKDTSTWSITKNTQYVILYVNHNIPSIVQWDPKVSVLL